MMMKNNYTITSFADLEREEIRVKKRIKKQEEELKQKLQTLPEEIVTAGVTKIITGILNGDIFRSAVSVIKTVSSIFSRDKEKTSDTGNGFVDIIKTIIKSKLSD